MKKILACLLTAVILFSMSMTVIADDETNVAGRGTWGKHCVKTGADGKIYDYYMDADGTFSAAIEENEQITWLYVEVVDHYEYNDTPIYTSCWFGISNFLKMNGEYLFSPGSRFCVRFLNRGTPEYEKYINLLDERTRQRIGKSQSFCEIEVIREDGTSYRNFENICELFVSGNVMFTDTSGEQVTCVKKMMPMPGLSSPEEGVYSVFLLDHFGEAFVLDLLSNWTGSIIDSSAEMVTVAVVPTVVGVTVAVAVCFILQKVKRKKQNA